MNVESWRYFQYFSLLGWVAASFRVNVISAGVNLLPEIEFPSNEARRFPVHRRGSLLSGKPASIETPSALFAIVLLVTLTLRLPAACGTGIVGAITKRRIPEVKYGNWLLSRTSFPLITAVTLSKMVPGATGRSTGCVRGDSGLDAGLAKPTSTPILRHK